MLSRRGLLSLVDALGAVRWKPGAPHRDRRCHRRWERTSQQVIAGFPHPAGRPKVTPILNLNPWSGLLCTTFLLDRVQLFTLGEMRTLARL